MSILLATRDPELISRCRRAVSAEHPLEVVDSVAHLLGRARGALPEVILLDADMLDTPIDRQASEIVAAVSGTRVIVMTAAFNEDEEIALLKAGVKGCCRRGIDAESLEQVLSVTYGGGVWVTRSLLPRLVTELRRYAEAQHPAPAAHKPGAPDKLSGLTPREKEIVRLIVGGASNKQVASALDISERTVKGHLSNVFQKLGVSDRLRLVLYVTDGKPVAAAAVRK
ncbi:MAG: LuxR C-terminal-related transcriptional regulator [Betaproteobacteria bacterium]